MKYLKSTLSLTLLSLVVSLQVNAQSVEEMIAGAVLPLPVDLREGATVYTYNENGERQVLRAGNNQVECVPKADDGFTRCYVISGAARRDLDAKLSAQGMSDDDIQLELTAAEEQGTIAPRTYGEMSYRLYGEDDRIQLLWMISLPFATSEVLGMPIASQRDNSLAGKGSPWMMLEGTAGAHVMIPINGTELSNMP